VQDILDFVEFVGRLIVPRSFPAFKTRLFGLLIFGASLNIGLVAKMGPSGSGQWWPKVELEMPGTTLPELFCTTVALVYLVTINFLHNRRNQRITQQIIKLAKDATLPVSEKQKIIDILVSRLDQDK
jgi:hypothetical protein